MARERDERGRFIPGGGGGGGGGAGRRGGGGGRRGSYVSIRDMGFERTIDRLMSLRRSMVTVGSLGSGPVQKYAAIWQAALGWKTRANIRLVPMLDPMFERVRNRVIDGSESFRKILGDFGDTVIKEYQDEIVGAHGLMSPKGTPGLLDTGAMRDSIRQRVRAPR